MPLMDLRTKRSRQGWGTVESEEELVSDSQDEVELEGDCSSDDDSRRGRCAISWKGSLEARFLKALQQAGGVWEAKPKAILQKMGAYATQLTTIQVKSHLQKHRIKVAAEMQRQGAAAGGAPPAPGLPQPSPTAPLQQARQAAQLQQAAARQATAAAATAQPKQRRRVQKQAANAQPQPDAAALAALRAAHQQRLLLQQQQAAAAAQRPPSSAAPVTPGALRFEQSMALAARHSAPAVLHDTASSGHQPSPVSGGSSSSGGGSELQHSRGHYSHYGHALHHPHPAQPHQLHYPPAYHHLGHQQAHHYQPHPYQQQHYVHPQQQAHPPHHHHHHHHGSAPSLAPARHAHLAHAGAHLAMASQPSAPAALWGAAPPSPTPPLGDHDAGWMDSLLGEPLPAHHQPVPLALAAMPVQYGGLAAHHPHEQQQALVQHQHQHQHPGSDSDSDHFHADIAELLDMPPLPAGMLSPHDEAFAGLCGLDAAPPPGRMGQPAWGLDSPGLF